MNDNANRGSRCLVILLEVAAIIGFGYMTVKNLLAGDIVYGIIYAIITLLFIGSWMIPSNPTSKSEPHNVEVNEEKRTNQD